jgi:hypothetical protein
VRNQKPIRGELRRQMTPYVRKEIRRVIKGIAREYGVSQSFVISVALAAQLGIKNQEQYDVDEKDYRKASQGRVLKMPTYSRKSRG